MAAKTQFFYQLQAARYAFELGTAVTTNQACHAREMASRAREAEEAMDRGESAEKAWHFYQTGRWPD